MQTLIISSDDIPERIHGFFHACKKHSRLYTAIGVGLCIIFIQQIQFSFQYEAPVVYADQNTSVSYVCHLKSDLEAIAVVSRAQSSSVVDEQCAERENNRAQNLFLDRGVLENSDKGEVDEAINQKAKTLVAGYPIEQMLPAMSALDKKTEAFLIGIAKKESDWGKHVPKKSGQDCFNYWGYKGSAGRGSAGAYACFASPEEAVKTVGAKLTKYVIHQNKDTASKMLVWKCGNSCAGHDSAGVSSWVHTVDTYRKKVL